MLFTLATLSAQRDRPPNVADPETFPYSDPTESRDHHQHSNHPKNEFRLYDFYQRQADYYLENGNVPEIIPAYPGMEAGINGHWGRYNNFDLFSDIWSQMDNGPIVSSVIRQQGEPIVKSVNLRLGEDQDVFATFDQLTLGYRMVWNGGFLSYPEVRWGMMGLVNPAREPFLNSWDTSWSNTASWKREYGPGDDIEYRGFYRFENKIVFSYKVHGISVLDHPEAFQYGEEPIFVRALHFPEGAKDINLKFFKLPAGAVAYEESKGDRLISAAKVGQDLVGLAVQSSRGIDGLSIEVSEEDYFYLAIASIEPETTLTTCNWRGSEDLEGISVAIDEREPIDIVALTEGGRGRWPEEFLVAGELGEGDGPYVIDTIPVPIDNPYDSPMYLSGLAFFENGNAAIATFFGDLWLVKGIDDGLGQVVWKRIAQGLNQPLGLEIVDGKIHAICKDQIVVLHDLNGDDEIDYFENFCNTFRTSAGGHDYNTGLQRDADGNFYFATKHDGVHRISPDGQTVSILADGLRNPNGIGVAPDGRVWVTPQEGQWTPASQIFNVREGAFYGHDFHRRNKPIEPATVYVPRGIDNSTGGQLYITTDKWGPMKDRLISFSFGANSHYLVLEDESGPKVQGAIVPLEGDFISGIHRGRIHPIDEQVFVVGTQGWGTYSQTHGSFERIRYTGKPVYHPIGFQVFQNGIRVDFDHPISPDAPKSALKVFGQQWQYIYTMGYGSPEFSIRNPDQLGHDPLEITSTSVVGDGRSLFVEIPGIIPAMTIYLRMHLEFASGDRFKTDLFATALHLGDAFTSFPEPRDIVAGKSQELELIIKRPPPVPDIEPGSDQPGRPIHLKALTGLKYDKTRISASPGERISLTLENTDVMPHNWVMVRYEGYTNVGEKADIMVNDPSAIEKQYIPEDRDILHHTRLLNPGESTTIHFNAPVAPGHYPFLCTFPGHWQVMRGYLIVY